MWCIVAEAGGSAETKKDKKKEQTANRFFNHFFFLATKEIKLTAFSQPVTKVREVINIDSVKRKGQSVIRKAKCPQTAPYVCILVCVQTLNVMSV